MVGGSLGAGPIRRWLPREEGNQLMMTECADWLATAPSHYLVSVSLYFFFFVSFCHLFLSFSRIWNVLELSLLFFFAVLSFAGRFYFLVSLLFAVVVVVVVDVVDVVVEGRTGAAPRAVRRDFIFYFSINN